MTLCLLYQRRALSSESGPVAQWIEHQHDEFGGCGFEAHQGHSTHRGSATVSGASFVCVGRLWVTLLVLSETTWQKN